MRISILTNMYILGILALIGNVWIGTAVYAAEGVNVNVEIGVIPFSPLGVDEDEAERIAEMIGTKLSVKLYVLDHEDVMDELEDEDCEDEEDWDDRECIQEVGEELDAEYMLAGSIGKVGALYVAHVFLYDVSRNSTAWSKEYRSEGTIDNLILSIPQQIADDVIQILAPSSNQTPEAPVQSSSYSYSPEKVRTLPPGDNGIVKGATIGVGGLFSVGPVSRNQSPAGFYGMFLYPTTDKSHVRVKAGVPLMHNHKNMRTKDKDNVDFQVSLEHEWGWEKIGLAAGLAYSPLLSYSSEEKYIDPWSLDTIKYVDEYDTYHAFNFVFNVRAGYTKSAFCGKVSFPLAIAFEEGRGNYVFEYSIFGTFGAKNTKVGIGNTGMFKHREWAKLKEYLNDSLVKVTEYKDANHYNTNFGFDNAAEFFACIPCIKVAHLFGDKVVVSIVMELGGIIIPRILNTDWWRPSLGFDFVFSLGKLDGPSVMNGTF